MEIQVTRKELELEIWKNIPGWEGYYQASNIGRIRSLDRIVYSKEGRKFTFKGKILKPRRNKRGYFYLGLHKGGKIKSCTVHRLIALTFIPNPLNYPQVHHRDDNQVDNNVNNLKWGTISQNSHDAIKNGRWAPMIGEKSPLSKLTEEQVIEIKRLWHIRAMSQKNIGKKFGIVQQHVSEIVNNIVWKHLAVENER